MRVINVTLYHADWCGHCKSFMPEWKKFVKHTGSSKNIVTKTIEDKMLENGPQPTINGVKIEGYPTIKIEIIDGKKKSEHDYDGKRTAGDLNMHVNNLMGQNDE